MSWTPEQLTKHPKFASLVGVNKKLQHSSSVNIEPLKNVPAVREPVENSAVFIVPGTPVGKPRMTQRDKWKKRPCVLAYRDYCDRIRAATPAILGEVDCYALDVIAHIAVKPSWKLKLKKAKIGKPHRDKPDTDNIVKSVADAMFENDSGIWDERGRKYWCAPEDERTQVTVRFTP